MSLGYLHPILPALHLLKVANYPRVYSLTQDQGTDAKQPSEAAQLNDPTGEGVGIAAVGETSTYSSHPLAKGDAVGSVVDSQSNDPTTYQMPEHSYGSNAGDPTGASEAAAALAVQKDR